MRLQSSRFVPNRKTMILITIMAGIAAVQSYATSVQVSSITYQAQYGIGYQVTTVFTAQDQGFSTIPSSQLVSLQPCVWVNGTSCLTTLTQGNYEYSLVLILNTPPSLLTTYTVTVNWSQIGGSQVQLGQLTVSVSALAAAGQEMAFQFDTGSSSFTTPLSIGVVVA